jgi:putative endonuclease
MNQFFVYVIFSTTGDIYYRGYSENPLNRLEQHRTGQSRYTSKFADWDLVYVECFETKREALIREKGIKKYSKAQIKNLVESPKNRIDLYR